MSEIDFSDEPFLNKKGEVPTFSTWCRRKSVAENLLGYYEADRLGYLRKYASTAPMPDLVCDFWRLRQGSPFKWGVNRYNSAMARAKNMKTRYRHRFGLYPTENVIYEMKQMAFEEVIVICPKCGGKGMIGTPEWRSGQPYTVPCNYEGCHAGHVHCCDGDRAEEEEDCLRRTALND